MKKILLIIMSFISITNSFSSELTCESYIENSSWGASDPSDEKVYKEKIKNTECPLFYSNKEKTERNGKTYENSRVFHLVHQIKRDRKLIACYYRDFLEKTRKISCVIEEFRRIKDL